ncbi:AcrR family transcriptional regulator [Microbacterium terrae]|uniref:HTH-type transcriptional regulator TtgR n=1 Tax=Microbacterium terrae TaxID=69369 RepID=A0A0M2H0L2_9MICO|nr:TetR/AcrR family transcriptional regulator [Microbacterium terrae]KJL37550.1 HTH-type transcriptional regulator TtgR [Microbacterium terrae]MBP1076380.1 AcrR family transcriptional regulator [Microbacterium terrae]GLJ97204.1 TetR family transcriptional regulator [Microbacterium terrae]
MEDATTVDDSAVASAGNGRRRGPYAKTARTRERIVDACEVLYAANGFRATTIKDIAELAGITDRGLVHHFPTREDLLIAVLERHEHRSSDAITGDDPITLLRAVLAQEAALEEAPNLVEMRTVLQAEATDPRHPAHEHYMSNYTEWRGFLAAVFGELRARGEVDAAMSDAELAGSFMALSDGLHLQHIYDRTTTRPSVALGAYLSQYIPALKE